MAGGMHDSRMCHPWGPSPSLCPPHGLALPLWVPGSPPLLQLHRLWRRDQHQCSPFARQVIPFYSFFPPSAIHPFYASISPTLSSGLPPTSCPCPVSAGMPPHH